MDGERNDGVLNMVARTKTLPMMDTSIRGALRIQFAISMVPNPELFSWLRDWLVPKLLAIAIMAEMI